MRKPEPPSSAMPVRPAADYDFTPSSAVETQSMDSNIRELTGDRVSIDYRRSHCAPGYGECYNKTYESGYYGALWAKIEIGLLSGVLYPMAGTGRKCLDFACGTGRITNLAAEIFPEVVGVDVSETMLACAQPSRNVRLLHVDITTRPLDETFDVITAFRFFLNAEERLKREALSAIYNQLNQGGRLVCNIHMNATSPVGIAYRLLNQVLGRTVRNTMSARRFKQILLSSNFVVERIIPYGYLPRPGYLAPRLCEKLILPVEKAAMAIGIPGRLAQHFLVVARKR